MKKVAIIQARMGSTRFPGKVLMPLRDKPLLQWVVEAAQRIPLIDQVVVATSEGAFDFPIVDFCRKNKIDCFSGSELDVLRRFYEAARQHAAEVIVRLTADCPCLDPYLAGQVLYLVSSGLADYATNTLPPTWPDGVDCEAFTMQALEQAFHSAKRESDREHVTPYLRNNHYLFKVRNVTASIPGLQHHRWTVDTKEDLVYLEHLLSYAKQNPTTLDLLAVVAQHPEISRPISVRNEGFEKSVAQETIRYENFQNSTKLLDRALKTIPLGAQTFSKSSIQYPKHGMPLFLTHGAGSHVWDVDGNEYVDLVSGLLPVVLGYNDPDVNSAIQAQLNEGISFSLSTELEMRLAETLVEIIPSAEKVRFAKNGTDVTTAAVRLARAHTGRDKMMVCGYHGWQDWSIGTTARNKGVPHAVCELSTAVPYNDLACVEALLKTKAYAGLILEPCNTTEPLPGYLSELKQLCEHYGSLLIFDEIITGFRFSLGGAQAYFGVTPHLSCFGKAMGNGMPISAIVGQDVVMEQMEEIFFSGTFGGETLSLAAALATIEKMQSQSVINYLWSYGLELSREVERLIDKYPVIKLVGYAPWKIIQFFDHKNASSFEIKTLFIQEMIRRGILMNASFNINFSHRGLEKSKILSAFSEVLALISSCLQKGTVLQKLKSPVIQPLFKVR